MARTKDVIVYPVSAAALPGLPHVPIRADTETAERLVASRAFAYEGSADGEAVEFDDEWRPALDRWVSPVPHGSHYKQPEAAPAAAPVETEE